MGIKNLLKFLSEYDKTILEGDKIIKEIDISQYKGKKIAIDISILIYQIVIAIRNSGSDLTNNKGEITSHILGIFNKTINFLDKGIIPVYVFDGKPPQLKYKVLDARKQVRKRALDKLSDATTELDKIKYLKRSVSITREQMDQCRELLQLMGIPYIDAIEEADSELSYLCKENLVYAVLTEDMDILTFGSPRVIRNLSSSSKIPIEIELNNILNKLKLNYEEFVDLCILFGCDYCPVLIDVKPPELFSIYNECRSIEKTLLELKKRNYSVPEYFEYYTAKDYFMNPSHNTNIPREFKLMRPDTDKLVELLVDKYGLIKYKVIEKLNKLVDHYFKIV